MTEIDSNDYKTQSGEYAVLPQCGNLLSPEKYFVNQLFSNFVTKNVVFTKFLSTKCES